MIEDDVLPRDLALRPPGAGAAPGVLRPDPAPADRAGRRHHRSPRSRSSGSCSTGPGSTPTSAGLDVRRRGGRGRGAAPLGGGAHRARDRPDGAGRPARLGGQVPAARRLPRAPRPATGATPAWPPWTCSTTTCGRRSRWPPGSGCERLTDDDEVERGDDRAARRHPGLLPGRVPAAVAPTTSWPPTGTRWCSTSAASPLRRVPMMEPSRGTEAHVGSLIDESAHRGRAARAARVAEARPATRTNRGAAWPNESRTARRPQPRSPRSRSRRRPATSEQGEKIKAELDDLLDEIDEVLETNAEDFVKSLRPEGRRVAAPPARAQRRR